MVLLFVFLIVIAFCLEVFSFLEIVVLLIYYCLLFPAAYHSLCAVCSTSGFHVAMVIGGMPRKEQKHKITPPQMPRPNAPDLGLRSGPQPRPVSGPLLGKGKPHEACARAKSFSRSLCLAFFGETVDIHVL